MEKYIKPNYELEIIETQDIVLSSVIKNVGEATVGNITGSKGVFESAFSDIF